MRVVQQHSHSYILETSCYQQKETVESSYRELYQSLTNRKHNYYDTLTQLSFQYLVLICKYNSTNIERILL